MKLLLNIALAASLALPAMADEEQTIIDRWKEDPVQIFDGAEITLEDLRWTLRPLVVFADTPDDPRFERQMELLLTRIGEMALRDVIVITDTDPAARSDLRLALRPRGFMLALVAKDGGVAFRKPAPYDVREISNSVDKMPLRKQEIRDRRNLNQ